MANVSLADLTHDIAGALPPELVIVDARQTFHLMIFGVDLAVRVIHS